MASQNPEGSRQEEVETPISPEALMSTMKEMMKMISQHREELSKHSEANQNTLNSPPPSQPEASSKTLRETTIQKLAKFKKFVPKPFKEAITPNEAEEWLEELEAVLEALQTEEEDRMIFTEFLLQGEARLWWKMEKEKKGGVEHTWKEFQDIFLHRYFSISVHEKKEKEFLYLSQGNQSVIQYD